jgi:phosphate acetyltransferase
MSFIRRLRAAAAGHPRRIALPEAHDPRVREAARILESEGIAIPVLIGPGGRDPSSSPEFDRYAAHLYERRRAKGMSEAEAAERVRTPLYFAAVMTALGDADGCVTGADTTTADVLRAALHAIGLHPGEGTLSSAFIMELPDGRVFTMGDCAVVPYPTAAQLADIAIQCGRTHRDLLGETPRVAMLSFSSKGSAAHERVDLVREALELARSKQPQLDIDGELQFDAAWVPSIGARKAPGSAVAGHANVFVFPNLDAGNIGYKLVERLAGAAATGPVIQGLARPMHDLSRGCSVDDIVNTAAVAAIQAVQRT